ncbi:hypothetical protein BGZ74_005072 [Mortierella antarctica]|nr:hypothetical protein BGZ74_005072 [Mortierella antarctica]
MFQSTHVLIATVLEPHTNLKTRHNLRGMRRKWHKALLKWLCIDYTLSDSEDSIMCPGGADSESDDQLDGPSGPSDYDGDIDEIELSLNYLSFCAALQSSIPLFTTGWQEQCLLIVTSPE